MFSISEKSLELLKKKASVLLATDSDKVVVEYEEKTIYYDELIDYHTNIDFGYDSVSGHVAFLLSFTDLTRYKDDDTEEQKLPRCVVLRMIVAGGENQMSYKFKENDERTITNLNTFIRGFGKGASNPRESFYRDSTFQVRYLSFMRK